jgi:hypothetical protein
MRHTIRVLLVGAFSVAASPVATPAHAQAPATKGGYVVTKGAPAAQGITYLSTESAFVAGRTVYLRSTKTLIGTIEKVDESHAFPPTFPKSPAKAVLIRRKDRSKSWMPVEGITKLYVVGK